MEVHLTPGQPASLAGIDELRCFSVVIDAAPAALPALAAACDGILAFDGPEHAWVSVHWLVEASGRGASPEWRAAFGTMVDYAASQGWTRADRRTLRGHVVWQGG